MGGLTVNIENRSMWLYIVCYKGEKQRKGDMHSGSEKKVYRTVKNK